MVTHCVIHSTVIQLFIITTFLRTAELSSQFKGVRPTSRARHSMQSYLPGWAINHQHLTELTIGLKCNGNSPELLSSIIVCQVTFIVIHFKAFHDMSKFCGCFSIHPYITCPLIAPVYEKDEILFTSDRYCEYEISYGLGFNSFLT